MQNWISKLHLFIKAIKPYSSRKGVTKISGIDIVNADLFVEEKKIGKVKGVIIDPQKWGLTHLEVELTKEAAAEILGANTAVRNRLAVSALQKGKACCTEKGVVIKVSLKQLPVYLRPA
jgi:hypothetical protein